MRPLPCIRLRAPFVFQLWKTSTEISKIAHFIGVLSLFLTRKQQKMFPFLHADGTKHRTGLIHQAKSCPAVLPGSFLIEEWRSAKGMYQ